MTKLRLLSLIWKACGKALAYFVIDMLNNMPRHMSYVYNNCVFIPTHRLNDCVEVCT